MPKLPKFSFNVTGIPGGPGGAIASVAGAIFLFAGLAYVVVPGEAPAPEPVAQTVDTMPTASTGPEQAEVKITEEKLSDDVAAVEQPLPPAVDETAGTNLEGLAALIEENAVVEPAKPKKKGKKAETAAASEVPQPLEVTSADDVKLTPEGREFGAKTGGTRLILRAKSPVWVRIEDTSGTVVMTQMLMKGDSVRVPDRDGLVVIARDGGALSYVIDGQEKGVLGSPGEILVGRSLDIKALDGQG